AVIDPEIGLNVVELGLIRKLGIDESADSANITMILTTPFCPYGPHLLSSISSEFNLQAQG
ncbi:MAG: metal-sulfur cluster assembly factor, partial [Anaerolineales bacterium]